VGQDEPMTASVFESLLHAEGLAARIEAACRAEPDLGRLWRAEGAILEAVASVGLEGVRIDAQDLLPRVAFNSVGSNVEPWDAERALKTLRILKRPGNPFADPSGTIRRIEGLLRPVAEVAWADLGESEEGRGVRRPLVPDEELPGVMQAAHPSDPPILGALRVVTAWRETAGRAEPLFERTLFAAVEGALRGMAAADPDWQLRCRSAGQVLDRIEEVPLRGLSEGTQAEWVALPALALTRTAFRQWDPSSAKGVREILEGTAGSLRLELGRLIPLREWLHRAREAGQGRTGRSRLADAARAFIDRPVMRATDLADHLGITPRGATNLAVALEDQGLLGEVTHRRAARIWATPEVARLLEPRAVTQRIRGMQKLATGKARNVPQPDTPLTSVLDGTASGRVAQEWQASKARHEARLDRIYEDLDAALLRADSLLGRK
jgi:hypothetical protein